MTSQNRTCLTGKEVFFDYDDLIVTKTDTKGRITYVNDVFLRVAGYSYKECLGQPHNIIRHPDMPRCVFQYLWDTIPTGREVFAYVVNKAKNGDHYWVFAHVTASYDSNQNLIGYHSTRRLPDRAILENAIIPLYAKLLEEENQHANRKQGQLSAMNMLVELLDGAGVGYDEFIATL